MNKQQIISLLAMAFTTTVWASGNHEHQHGQEGASGSKGGSMMQSNMAGMHDTMPDMHNNMAGHQHSVESLAGHPGNAADATREIKVIADDTMHFQHESLNIKDGETIRFMVTNNGKIPHEFSIGTKEEHQDHSTMMMANPNMHHAPGGNTVTVKPGETRELLWTFENAWQIEVACNMPGHYQAGMHSPVTIQE